MGPQPCLSCAQCRARVPLSPEPRSPRAGPMQPFIRMRGCGSVPSLPQVGPSRTPGLGLPCSVSLRVPRVLCGDESSLVSWMCLRPCPGLGLVSTGRSSEMLAGSASCLARDGQSPEGGPVCLTHLPPTTLRRSSRPPPSTGVSTLLCRLSATCGPGPLRIPWTFVFLILKG